MKILITWLTNPSLRALAEPPFPAAAGSLTTNGIGCRDAPRRAALGDPGDKEVSHSTEQGRQRVMPMTCNIKGTCFLGVVRQRCGKAGFWNILGSCWEGNLRLRSAATALLFLAWMCCWGGFILLSLEKSLCCYNAFYVWRNTDIMCI